MKFLLVAKQEKNVAAYMETLRCLVERGHHVTVAIQERDDARDRRLAEQIVSDRFRVMPCPSARIDEWGPVAPLVRRLRDCVHYLRPPLRQSAALQSRIFHKLRQELGLDVEGEVLAAGMRLIPEAQLGRLEALLKLAEDGIPTSTLFDQFLESQRPDVLLLSPLVHFGSAQADVAASGRRLGIPVWMLLFSWDNLSTKGCMHVEPDLMFVWNEQQRAEAAELHGFPASRVVVAGAPRFDAFFRLRPAMTREQFHEPLGLDPSQPTLLYLCSSRLIAPHELGFVRRWVAALRASRADVLQRCNVVIRPHPDIALLPVTTPLTRHHWAAAPAIDTRIGRPFDDPRAVVVRTSYKDPEGLFESLVHSTAVVGLNTTAELEAGIAGRPVFTILPGEGEGGQQMTVHFHYLTREHGGFVSVASGLEEHLAQLEAALVAGADPPAIRSFVESFLRPHGLDRPVSPLLADALEERARAPFDAVPRTPAPASHAGAGVAAEGAATVPLAYRRARILVRATPEAACHVVDGAIPLNKSTVAWLERSVGMGDVVYDVNAGFGAYVLMAARQRGAIVVAFEPGYKVYAALCDNLLLNGCQGSVIPVPLALSDRDALGEMKYQRGHPGNERHVVRATTWRVRPPEALPAYVQPVCTMRLDTAIERYALPPPNHLRLAPHVSVTDVLEGAVHTVRSPSLRTIWLRVAPDDEPAVSDRLGALGLRAATRRVSSKSVQIVFSRDADERDATHGGVSRGMPA